VVLISHDRYLLDAAVTHIAELEDGKLTLFGGNYTEFVIDKATKLESIFDGIELLKLRFALLGLQEENRRLKNRLPEESGHDGIDDIGTTLAEEFRFLSDANQGRERMSDEMIDRVKAIAARTVEVDGTKRNVLTEQDVERLNVRQGTLTAEEREVIKNHATVTHKILSQLPFPKKLKHVPEYAAAHHEALNGRGYPRGIDASQLPLQSRILALADVFEALTAKDRPYKKANTLAEAMKILTMMARERHLDQDLFDFFRQEGIYREYARRELPPQIDAPD